MRQASKNAVLAAAGVLGLVTALLVYMFLAAQTHKTQDMVSIVVAKHGIPPGTVVDAAMLDVRNLPPGAAPQGVASAPEMLVGKVVSVPIKAGEPVSTSYVEAKNRLAQMIPPFMRAVTVAIDPISGVGGYLKPGDHVDVVATFSANEGTLTKTVLQDVTLVAMGSQVVGDDGARVTGKATDPTTGANATLVVLPGDAEKLVLADSKGKLRLTLRRSDDLSRIQPKGISSRGMVGVIPPDVPKDEPQTVKASVPPMPSFASSMASILGPLVKPVLPVKTTSLFKLKPLPLPGAEKNKATKKIEVIRGTKVEQTSVTE